MTTTVTTDSPPAGALLTSDDVADMLGVPRSTVQALSRTGKLPTVHIGRTNRYRRDAMERWIEENES
jgi:excisionase family DNA binding protein